MFHQILLIVDGSSSIPKTISLINKFNVTHSCLTAVYIIESGWRNILGDEWISNEGTRSNFFRYMEKNQHEHAQQVLDKIVQKAGTMNLPVSTLIKTGKPDKVVVSVYSEFGPFDLVILPHPTGKFAEGAVKINVEKVAKALACPVLIGPP